MEKTIKILKNYKWLILVFLIALTFRLYNVAEVPHGFDGDEAAFGYYGFSLINNLSDEYGNKLPLYFPSIGDYKYPVYAYLTTIPVLIFGLSEFSTRFLSAFTGSLLSVVVYFIVYQLTKKKEISLVSAVLSAFSPYGIIFSRGAYESNLATFLIAIGVFFILKFAEDKNSKKIFLSLIPLLLAIFTYSSVRVTLLLLLPAMFIFFKVINKKIDNLNLKTFFITVLIICLSVITLSFDARGLVRAKSLLIFNDPNNLNIIEEGIREDGWHNPGKYIFVTRIFHNKPIYHLANFTKRYIQHFDPTYLFIQSNPVLHKYSVPDMGLFYIFEFITLIFGIAALLKFKDIKLLIIPVWILISIIPSALTIETPNPIRSLPGLPAWIILSALGIVTIADHIKKKRKIVYAIFGFVLTLNFIYFVHQYFVHDLTHNPWYSDGGMKEMVLSVAEIEKKFDKVVVKQDPYIFFLFYNQITPQEFLKDSDVTPEKQGLWERVNRIGKIIFKMDINCPKIGRPKVLYVCKGTEVPQNSIVHKLIRFNDGTPAFTLLEFIPYSERKQLPLPDGLNWMVETDLSFPEALLEDSSGRYW